VLPKKHGLRVEHPCGFLRQRLKDPTSVAAKAEKPLKKQALLVPLNAKAVHTRKACTQYKGKERCL